MFAIYSIRYTAGPSSATVGIVGFAGRPRLLDRHWCEPRNFRIETSIGVNAISVKSFRARHISSRYYLSVPRVTAGLEDHQPVRFTWLAFSERRSLGARLAFRCRFASELFAGEYYLSEKVNLPNWNAAPVHYELVTTFRRQGLHLIIIEEKEKFDSNFEI